MEDLIAEIRSYTRTLIEERDELRREVKIREEALDRAKEQISQYERQISALEDSNKTLKIAKSLTGADENSDAKLKINELVREIDKCIALLNK